MLRNRLNPCFCGSWFVRREQLLKEEKSLSLNPCFCGSWFVSIRFDGYWCIHRKSLNPCFCGSWFVRLQQKKPTKKWRLVLILVFVEVGS